MSFVIDLPKSLEVRVEAEALRAGVSPTTFLVELIQAQLTENERDATLALFAQWEEEDATLAPERQEANERIYHEIEVHGIPRTHL